MYEDGVYGGIGGLDFQQLTASESSSSWYLEERVGRQSRAMLLRLQEAVHNSCLVECFCPQESRHTRSVMFSLDDSMMIL